MIGLTRFRLCRTIEQRVWGLEDSWSWHLSVPCHEDAFFAYSHFTHLGLSTSFAFFFQSLSFNMKQRSNCDSVHQGKYGMGTELLCPWYPLADSVSTLFVRNLLASYLVSLTRSQKSHSQSHELLSAGGFALCISFKDKTLVVALIIKEVNSSASSLVFSDWFHVSSSAVVLGFPYFPDTFHSFHLRYICSPVELLIPCQESGSSPVLMGPVMPAIALQIFHRHILLWTWHIPLYVEICIFSWAVKLGQEDVTSGCMMQGS